MKQDKMMICEHSGKCDHILHLSGGDSICSHWDKHECRHCGGLCDRTDGEWKCIPVEPEKPVNKEKPQCLRADFGVCCEAVTCYACEYLKPISEVEPQPATCPDCGHLVSEHSIYSVEGCKALIDGKIDHRCLCGKTKIELQPADLQPEKHCTGCPNPSDNYNCLTKEDCPEQPTPTMPLAKCAKGFTIRCSICEEIKPDDDGRCVYLQTQQAHDSEVAKQAVKDVASICDQLIELAEHGDYSNGNVSQGTDEGVFMAMRRLTELKAELAKIDALEGK